MARKFESMGAAIGVAAKAAAPTVLAGAGGALLGGVGLRFLLAKYTPAAYAKKWVPYAAGIGGGIALATVATMPFVKLNTKAGREKAFKATIPLVVMGAGASIAAITFGGRVLAKFRTAYPNLAAALNPEGYALPPPPVVEETAVVQQTAPVRQLRQLATFSRSRGLNPAQWSQLESRAAGLTSSVPTGASSRWAA